MAVNTNKRIPVKWVRDRAKSAYTKLSNCYICETTNELELHHTHSITLLLQNWSKQNNIDISTDEAILAVRDRFIQEHHSQIYTDVFTLCNKHHVALHAVFGKAPSLTSALKQRNWIELQKAKSNNSEPVVIMGSSLGNFSEFIKDEYAVVRFKDLVSTR